MEPKTTKEAMKPKQDKEQTKKTKKAQKANRAKKQNKGHDDKPRNLLKRMKANKPETKKASRQ